MSISAKFNWARLTDRQFEELVYAVLASAAPERITWRAGPGDQGRDVEATFSRLGPLGEAIRGRYFVEAKHYQSGVPPTALAGALAWAQAEQPDVLLIAVSSHLTTPCRQHVEAWGRNNPRVRVLIWERRELENEILSKPQARDAAVAAGLLPPSIAELLPSNPGSMRATQNANHEFPMEYRYWITEEEVEKLGRVAGLLQRLGDALTAECGPHKYFEDVCLGIPNWTTFLALLQAQLRLQIAVRDYLFALHSDARPADIQTLADVVKRRVEEVRGVGDASFHVD
jgi:hypothetical protein